MEKVLTIVVPSYNTIKHIDNCLPSMIDNHFIEDIEILLINDGSSDNTLSKLKEYAANYPNSIRVINKENGGHGSVINRGIQEAKGKYFRVVDGDDPVITENLNKLVKKLVKENADIVITPFYKEYIEKKERVLCGYYNLDEGKQYLFDEICQNISVLPLHAINYKTAILRDNAIKVQEHCFYEDKEYILYPIPFIKTISYYSDPVYVYRIGVPGQSISAEKVIKNRTMLETIAKNLCNFYNAVITRDISLEKENYLSNAICDVIKNVYGMYLKMPYGQNTMSLINAFSEECIRWSPRLYEKSNDMFVIRQLRKKSFLVYSVAYLAFKIKMKKRGY